MFGKQTLTFRPGSAVGWSLQPTTTRRTPRSLGSWLCRHIGKPETHFTGLRTILPATLLAVVLDERIHGGPPDDRCWTTSHRRMARRFPAQAPQPGISRGRAPCLVLRRWAFVGVRRRRGRVWRWLGR